MSHAKFNFVDPNIALPRNWIAPGLQIIGSTMKNLWGNLGALSRTLRCTVKLQKFCK
jgi:hypothetical protein